jgi:hypothetical protein
MKNIISKFYVVAAFLCSTAIMFAQPGDTSNDVDPGGMEGADNQAPIGDYLWVLVVVGLVFVYFKFRSMQKNSIQG